jgi:hypothetical protein
VIDARYLIALTALAALAAGVAWPLVDLWPGGREGLAAGLAFSLVSLGAGYHALRWGANGGGSKLFATVVGSMLARFAALFALAFGLAWGTDAHVAVALLTVVALHLALGTFEIVYLKRTDALE